MPTIHPLALACTAVLGFLLFGLGLVVSLTRGKTQVLIGVTDDPDHILNRIVRASSNPGDVVMDFFAGSGTLGESCLHLGRQFWLVDNNPQALETMQRRFAHVPGIEWIGLSPTP